MIEPDKINDAMYALGLTIKYLMTAVVVFGVVGGIAMIADHYLHPAVAVMVTILFIAGIGMFAHLYAGCRRRRQTVKQYNSVMNKIKDTEEEE